MNELTWDEVERNGKTISFRKPEAGDGLAVNRLIAACPPLDRNSVYCNILQCDLFADTCVVAEQDDKLVGFVSAMLDPRQTTTLFVWQIVVHEEMRGQGLAEKLLDELMLRPPCRMVTHIQATINPGNKASWVLFERFARRLHTSLEKSDGYPADHFDPGHEDETRITIGPLATPDHANYDQ